MKRIKTEYNLFRYKMLLYPAEDLYNSCRMICFYECLHEYFRYCEKINVGFINAADKEEWVLEQLWELYLENEYLKADTWDEIESILKAYVDMKLPQAENNDTCSQTDNTDSLKEETGKDFGSSILEVSLKMSRDDVISRLLPEIMKSALLEKECIVKEEGIRDMIEVLNDLGHNGNIRRTALKKQYHLSEKEISRYL